MKILTPLFLIVLVAYWHSIVYASDDPSLHQYLVSEFFKDKTDKLLEKYQSDGKGTLDVAYLPLMSVVGTPEQPESIAILNEALYAYLTSMAGESASIDLTKQEEHHTIAQILLICDDFLMTQADKIQRIEALIEPVDVIVTGYYLDEDDTLKVKIFVVSTIHKRIEGKGIIFQKDNLICSDSPKRLCKEAYKEMVTTINAVILGESLTDKKVGILPFSKLMSDSVKKKIGKYSDELELSFVNNFKKKGILVSLAEYPKAQEPFTYEEMTAPPFEIDPEDFATPEQILADISQDQAFDTVIFGHFEEVSDALLIIARVYSKSEGKITSVQPVQQIKLKKLEVDRVKTAIEVLAVKIVDLI
ncbi:hypothetical protein PN36_08830 [Candidatus Thiomargarita nelsonii]|uniref:Uncharacterized protein n=1 Tax=Candidatus Thiomargarita nelsonii TaxID=1003181 RepID=A0A0A6P6P8_9GAMM|nr:hypothetical protein PN36_08830 [Candidatus Thiomargarita nelsonii]